MLINQSVIADIQAIIHDAKDKARLSDWLIMSVL